MTHLTLLAQVSGIHNPVLPEFLGTNANGAEVVGQIISGLIGGMFIIGFVIALFYLVTGAFHWITSAGEKTNLEHARNKIIHALMGLVVLAAVWAVMTLVSQFLGLDLMHLPLPSIIPQQSSPKIRMPDAPGRHMEFE